MGRAVLAGFLGCVARLRPSPVSSNDLVALLWPKSVRTKPNEDQCRTHPQVGRTGSKLGRTQPSTGRNQPGVDRRGGGDCWSTQAPMWPKLDQSQANWGKFSRTRPKLGLTRPLVAYKAFGTSQACSWSNRGRRRSGRSPERRAQREVLSDDLSGRGFPTAAGGEPWESELPPNPSIDLGGHKRHRREAWPVARRTARGSGKRPRGLARCAANVAPKPLALDHSPLPTTTTESR